MLIPKKNRLEVYKYLFRGAELLRSRRTAPSRAAAAKSVAAVDRCARAAAELSLAVHLRPVAGAACSARALQAPPP
jgi:hypothetical protein